MLKLFASHNCRMRLVTLLLLSFLAVQAAQAHGYSTAQDSIVTIRPPPTQNIIPVFLGQDKGEENIKIADLDVAVWAPQHMATHNPLVIFSHGFHGCNTQSSFLMKAMAADGYIVVAPNHKDSSCVGGILLGSFPEGGKPKNWTDQTYTYRKNDIVNLIAGLRQDSKWSHLIDWSNVALAGHSLGGYTVLGLGGAWPSWKLPGIKAILALSPGCAAFVDHGDLKNISSPVMLQGGTRDSFVTPNVSAPGGCYDKTPSPAYFINFKGVRHLSFAYGPSSAHDDITLWSLWFLDKYLKGSNAPSPTSDADEISEFRQK